MTGRYDGFMNVLNGVGTRYDLARQYKYRDGSILSHLTLSSMYMDSGIVQRIVDMVADEAVKNWFVLQGDPTNEILMYLDDLAAEQHFANALRWARLYGGAAILVRVNDGKDLTEPIDENGIDEIESLVVYEMPEIFDTNFIYMDSNQSNYGEVELYQIQPVGGGASFYVHETRLIRFIGQPMPSRYKALRLSWGKSVIQGLWEAVLNYQRVNGFATTSIERMAQFSLQVPKLTEMLGTVEGEENVRARVNSLDMSMNILNTVVLDEGEELNLFTVALTRLPETMDQIWQVVAAETGFPMSKLFGKTPNGMNATGESDLENWYSMIKSAQRRSLKPALEKLIRLIYLSKTGPTKGLLPEEWSVDFNELWLPSEKERAETDEKRANALEKLVGTQIVDPSEARAYLEQEGFPIDSSIDPLRVPEEE